jgi:hypothetical protein
MILIPFVHVPGSNGPLYEFIRLRMGMGMGVLRDYFLRPASCAVACRLFMLK